MDVFEGPRGGAKNIMPGTWPKNKYQRHKNNKHNFACQRGGEAGQKTYCWGFGPKIMSIGNNIELQTDAKKHKGVHLAQTYVVKHMFSKPDRRNNKRTIH